MENSLLEAIKSGNMGCHSELTIIPISQSSKSNSQYAVSSTSPQSTVSLSLVPNTSTGKSKNKHSLPSNAQGAPRKRGKSSMPPLNHMTYDMNNYNPLLDLTMNRKHYPNYNTQPEQQWPFNLPFNYPELLMNFSQVNKRKSYAYEQTKEKTAVNYNKENTQNKTKHYKHEHMPPPSTTTDRISGQLENVEKTFDIDSLSSEDGWAKYRELLMVIEEMSGSIRPIYTGCKNSTERLKKSIHKAKALVSECLKEVEKVSRQLMEGFDTPGIFFSGSFGDDDNNLASSLLHARTIKKTFKEFLKTYNEENFNYKYRDTLKRNCNLGRYWLEINVEDLAGFDENLADKLYKQPVEHLPAFEEAATELAQQLIAKDNSEGIEHIQILLATNSLASSLRSIKSESVSRLVKIPGIIVSASSIRAKATEITLQCRSCRNVLPRLPVKPGMDGYILPRKCTTEQAGRPQCPLDPYFIIPDKCKCVDSQILKLQELSDSTPQGEMPRHVQLYCDRYLCERVVPGNRVMVVGVYSIKKVKTSKKQNIAENSRTVVGVRAPYLRVLGFQMDDQVGGFTASIPTTVEDEELFRKLASSPDIYERIAKSIAPSIFGFTDIKKSIACLLFGGSRKRLPDGLTRRGDINLLLLGDPGTAKSQLLKFVQQVSPIGVYTSGKGSSAAGLTASVIRDPMSHNFVVEGGAMVLADSGVVCIDEFDKMRENDRVAIHEAMEQQTISIAKAGITTTLNSRCSVMAAANSVFGRWDDSKGEDNIDFMPTILSRFDMIFIIKDEHNKIRDMALAKHIINVHLMNGQAKQEEVEGELPLATIKKFLNYCRQRCGPRLSEEAGEKLKSRYVIIRTGCHELESEKKLAIPITVRQLEAIIRIAESLAKMQLQPFATESHVDEALRLFQVSTLSAATSGCLSGVEGFSTEEDTETLQRIEKQLKRRFPIGSQVSEFSIIQDFLKQKYPQRAIDKVIYLMIRRGEIQHIMQRKMLFRLK